MLGAPTVKLKLWRSSLLYTALKNLYVRQKSMVDIWSSVFDKKKFTPCVQAAHIIAFWRLQLTTRPIHLYAIFFVTETVVRVISDSSFQTTVLKHFERLIQDRRRRRNLPCLFISLPSDTATTSPGAAEEDSSVMFANDAFMPAAVRYML